MKVFILLSFAAGAIAQTVTSNSLAAGIISSAPATAPANGWFFSSSGAGQPGGAVTGMPYSAEQVTEHVQTLADGTHITQAAQKTMLYRDSQGRTRIERSFPVPPGASAASQPGFIEISDPVSGAHYTLEPNNHTARRMYLPPPPPTPPNSGTVAASRRPQAEPGGTTALGLLPAPAAVRVAQVQALDNQALRPQLSHESLGTQTIEGVSAVGSRTTVVYPVGAIGNDRPITTVSESWTSPELRMVVLSKNSDPRNGDSTTSLKNISRAEPDPALFQVPPDYEVIDPDTAAPKR